MSYSHSLNLKSRLSEYGVFSDENLDNVIRVSENQARFSTYKDYFKSLNLPSATRFVSGKRGVPLLDYRPKKPADRVIVFHLPMANPLDPNQMFQVATLADLFPASRIIAFGNPAGGQFRYKEQDVSFLDFIKIAFLKNVKPLIAPEVDYLQSQNIKSVYHVGYSYGAFKAAAEAYHGSVDVDGVVLVEPLSKKGNVLKLAKMFSETLGPLGEYASRSGSGIYIQARNDCHGEDYKRSLTRPINIAIAFLMSRYKAMEILNKLSLKKPNLKITTAWGSVSEIGDDEYMRSTTKSLEDRWADIKIIRLKNEKHALANDIYLHAAILREALG